MLISVFMDNPTRVSKPEEETISAERGKVVYAEKTGDEICEFDFALDTEA